MFQFSPSVKLGKRLYIFIWILPITSMPLCLMSTLCTSRSTPRASLPCFGHQRLPYLASTQWASGWVWQWLEIRGQRESKVRVFTSLVPSVWPAAPFCWMDSSCQKDSLLYLSLPLPLATQRSQQLSTVTSPWPLSHIRYCQSSLTTSFIKLVLYFPQITLPRPWAENWFLPLVYTGLDKKKKKIQPSPHCPRFLAFAQQVQEINFIAVQKEIHYTY